MVERVFALKEEHEKLGAEFAEWNGALLVASYSGITAEQEHDAVRDAAGMYDLSSFRKLWVRGKDARDVLNKACTRDIYKLEPGRATYTCVLTDDGGVVDDSVVFCTKEEEFLYVIGTGNSGAVIEDISTGRNAHLTWDDRLQLISLQGPKSVDILSPNMDRDLHDLKFFQHFNAKLFDRDVFIARVGYSGERGYKIYVSPEDAPYIWRHILESGRKYDVKPCSFASLTPVRVESGLLFHPFDVNEDTTPWEVGLGFTIDETKGHFVGKDAVLSRRGQERFLVRGVSCPSRSLVLDPGDDLYLNGRSVGKVITPAYSHRLERSLAIAYIDPGVEEGASLAVGKSDVPAVVVENLPFYDKDRKRLYD